MHVYRLGDVAFTLRDSATALSEHCEALLVPAAGVTAVVHEAVNCGDLRDIVAQILKLHLNCIWIDAACLLSSTGKQILLSGLSCSGKSTTAIALAFGYGWRIFSEDIVLLDYETDKIVSFAAPFSCKKGTVARLEQLIGGKYELVDGEWLSSKGLHAPQNVQPKFDLCFHFSMDQPEAPMQLEQIIPATFIRKIVSCSNILHDDRGSEKFEEYISDAVCYHISNGSLAERVELISAKNAV